MKNLIKDFIKNEDGVTAIEYAIIGVAMAAGLGLVLGSTNVDGTSGSGFMQTLGKAFKSISDEMTAS